jgi:hypothetical protein
MINRPRWDENELQYLVLAYPDPNISTNDICNYLGRTKRSIRHKANRLHLVWRFENRVISEHKRDPAYDMRWYYNNRDRLLKKRRHLTTEKKKVWEKFKSSLKCEVCGENHPAILEFHHNDPSKKEGNISYMYLRNSWRKLMEEIAKCKILCANHHRILHWEEKQRARSLID